ENRADAGDRNRNQEHQRQQDGEQQQAFVAEHQQQLAERDPVRRQVADDRVELLAEGGVVVRALVTRRHIGVAGCRHRDQSTSPASSGTKTTCPSSRRLSCPAASRSSTTSDCAFDGPTGATMMPPGASWSASPSTSAGAAAVTRMASNGPFSGQPRRPSSCLLRTSSPSWRNRLRALRSRSPIRSTVCTSSPSAARIAAWYPDPVPTSSTFPGPAASRTSVILATTHGWEMVWPWPIGSAVSS